MSLYEEVKATGGYISDHEADLYIEVNDVNKEILSRHPLQEKIATTFHNQVTGKLCYDIPFAYEPFWIKKNMSMGQTLHDAIAARGWTSQKENDVQRRTWCDAQGNRLGSFTAEEGWTYLYRTAEDQLVIIPHRHRQERRAVWNKSRRVVTYEMLRGDAWVADYTIHDAELRSEYFQEFYGWPLQNREAHSG